jgi:hypothetical protein
LARIVALALVVVDLRVGEGVETAPGFLSRRLATDRATSRLGVGEAFDRRLASGSLSMASFALSCLVRFTSVRH